MPTLKTWIGHPIEREAGNELRRSGVLISARTVEEVLAETSRILGVRFEPHDGPMWWRAYGIPGFGSGYMITDIKVERGDAMSYPMRPKRDISFQIQDADTVSVFGITD
jgi:hypothetical protein